MAASNAKDFVNRWLGRGNEKQETQQFWNDLIFNVLDAPSDTVIEYEKPVKINGRTKYIDAYLPDTRTLIEQKSLGIDLMKTELQSDGSKLTPYEQGRRYGGYLPYDEQPRWIIDSNFEEIRVHDMKHPGNPPEIIKLKDMAKDFTRLGFLINTEDEHIRKEFEVSVKAGEIVGVLYDRLYEQFATPEAGALVGDMYNKMREGYSNPDDEHVLQSLNKLCVRIVFCLYAEDAGLFGNNTHAFHDYMAQFNGAARFRNGLKELFLVLNQPPEQRDRFLDPELAAFPYVNGGLFADTDIEYPFFTDEIVDIILEQASADFDWSDISPTIFGAIFESTLNPETRRSGGMHYTAIENIHKVIDPLFLDDLRAELKTILSEPIDRTRDRKLRAFQDRLADLKFLDPAAGSGNFLTESYLCLRRLENEAIEELQKGQITMAYGDMPNPIRVSIHQFYGIEINDFACSVAQTAMWIAEAKMMKETEAIVKHSFEFFPLKSNANIVEGNALQIDWNQVIDASSLSYIMGNPPFLGSRIMNKTQKKDLLSVLKGWKNANSLDYVVGWYVKSLDMMDCNSRIKASLVSTNSITQGDQVALVWKNLLKRGVIINYAYRTFIWNSESNEKAHVHCVIIGFSKQNNNKKIIFDGAIIKRAENINPYLLDADNVLVESAAAPLQDGIPECRYGSLINDKGNYIFDDESLPVFLKKEPNAKRYIRPFIGAYEYINGKKRYILYLKNISPSDLRSMPEVLKRVNAVREFRLNSTASATAKSGERPTTFFYDSTCDHEFLLIPRTSSERRRYIPIGFMPSDVVASDATAVVHNADMYMFGILSSNVHMSWMRVVAGRLKSDYRYAPKTVYNTFPWPSPTDEQKKRIAATAQNILDIREQYKDSSLADLYDPDSMPYDLLQAHNANNRAVLDAYGFDIKTTEQDCVAKLMRLYQKLTEE